MIYSMTGFGKGSAEGEGFGIEVELNSVNSRYLDLRIKMPGYLSPLENRIRSYINEKVERGKINIFINVISSGPEFSTARIDFNVAESFYNQLMDLKSKLDLPGQIDINTFMAIPDIIVAAYSDEEIESILLVISTALRQALGELLISRSREGETLCEDIQSRIVIINMAVESIEKITPVNNSSLLKKLQDKLKLIVGDVQVDESRLITEAGILAERYDITEELVRLKSHLMNIEEDLEKGGPIGKRLNFIIQEMGREVNTIGSKCNNSDISILVINIKEELEKIREQAANLE
ncbi:MAG: YicC family protein [candidate division Zixibacteria bacterium]|nr:YicC family protein [candidate division Zixibacteria bacterium]